MYGKREIIGFGTNEFYIKEIDRNLAIKIICENHYSKKVYNATYIHLGLFINNELLGVLQFGYAMNPASCGSVVKDTNLDEYLELNRMWLNDKAPRNSESKALSFCISYIRGKFKKVKWIQSFADERCGGFGIVYQAANFKYFGEHTATFWELDNIVYHNSMMTSRKAGGKKYDLLQANKEKCTSHTLRQFRYIYFINQKCIKDCLLKEQKFPKHYENTLQLSK
jgi:hypothetical protein